MNYERNAIEDIKKSNLIKLSKEENRYAYSLYKNGKIVRMFISPDITRCFKLSDLWNEEEIKTENPYLDLTGIKMIKDKFNTKMVRKYTPFEMESDIDREGFILTRMEDGSFSYEMREKDDDISEYIPIYANFDFATSFNKYKRAVIGKKGKLLLITDKLKILEEINMITKFIEGPKPFTLISNKKNDLKPYFIDQNNKVLLFENYYNNVPFLQFDYEINPENISVFHNYLIYDNNSEGYIFTPYETYLTKEDIIRYIYEEPYLKARIELEIGSNIEQLDFTSIAYYAIKYGLIESIKEKAKQKTK